MRPAHLRGLDEDRDPAGPGEELTYTLTFGNRSAALAPNTQLRLPLPPGTSFLNAPGAVVADGIATWDLGTFDDVGAGTGRSVSVMPKLAATAPDGTVVPFEVLLTGSSGQWRRVRRSVLVEDGRNLDLGLDEDRDPAVRFVVDGPAEA